MLDAKLIKQDFPLLERKIDGRPLVYLDSNATTQKPKQVIESLMNYYTNTNANIHRGIYTLSEESTASYENVREQVKQFINAQHLEEIIFTSGTTESINLVAYSWGRKFLKKGDVIVLTEMEHHSNFVPWFRLKEELELEIKFVKINDEGLLVLDDYKNIFASNKVKLVCLPHVSNVLGTINDVEEVIKMSHQNGALVLVDGAQGVPHLTVDVQKLDVDFYAFSSHKMLGPTGVGVLYGKKNILQEMDCFHSGGDMILSVHKTSITYNDLPWRFEAGTPNIAGVIGLGSAINYLTKIGIENIHTYEQELIKMAYQKFEEELGDEIKIFGPNPFTNPAEKSAVLSFEVQGIHPHDVASILNEDNICVRAGHHCAQPLMEALNVPALTRASFYLYNTKEDIDALVLGLKKAIKIFA